MRTSALTVGAVLGASILLVCAFSRHREGFGFASDVCDSINKESGVYRGAPRLQELCSSAKDINPSRTCLVDCDVDKLCGDPSVGLCRRAKGSPLLCKVTADYYGSHPDNADLPDVYRVRRGTCIVFSADGEPVADGALERAMMRFPDEVAIVGSRLSHASRMQSNYSVTFSDNRGGDGRGALPAVEPDYAVHATAEARRQGVAARIPTAVLHESCVSPGGHDTSFKTDPAAIQQRIIRAKDHENQPPILHVTARFSLPETASATIAGVNYTALLPGQQDKVSEVSGKKLSLQTEVWIMVAVSPKTGSVTEAREVLKGSDGFTHVTRVRTGEAVEGMGWGDGDLVSYTGQPPDLWVGMRDAATDVTLF